MQPPSLKLPGHFTRVQGRSEGPAKFTFLWLLQENKGMTGILKDYVKPPLVTADSS